MFEPPPRVKQGGAPGILDFGHWDWPEFPQRQEKYFIGGVPLDEPAVAGHEAEGDCKAPGVSIKWDADGAWKATVLQGEQKGQTFKATVEKLSLAKWTAVDAVHNYGVDFESATQEQRKQATFDFLELHMQRVMVT